MYPTSKTIYVVDDDSVFCIAVTATLARFGYNVVCFSDADSLLAVALIKIPVCILLDLSIPGSSGTETLQRLHPATYPAPILMMSAYGSIAAAVAFVQDGAYDFIEKPFCGADLVQRIERARSLFARNNPVIPRAAAHEPLTLREQEVLTQWVAGATSKEIARKFGLSPRTIENHRAKIMKKLHAKNSAEIVKLAVSQMAGWGIHSVQQPSAFVVPRD